MCPGSPLNRMLVAARIPALLTAAELSVTGRDESCLRSTNLASYAVLASW